LRPSSFTSVWASIYVWNAIMYSSVNLEFFIPDLFFGNRTLVTFP
jgi:hypothetical protein